MGIPALSLVRGSDRMIPSRIVSGASEHPSIIASMSADRRAAVPTVFVRVAVVLAAMALAACSNTQSPPPVAADVSATPPQVIQLPKGAGSSIPVVVNGEPITQYDINQRLSLIRLSGAKMTVDQAKSDLVDETLELQEAQARGLNVPQDQVDGAFASIAAHLKMTPPILVKALAAQGIQADTLKRRLKAQIAWQQLVEARTAQKGAVANAEVTALISSKDPSALQIHEYVLQQIVFVVPSGSAPAVYAQRQQEAAAFRQSFPGCDNSLDVAKKLRGVVVKDIGRRDSTQLSGPQGDAIAKTAVGSTAPPDRTDEGIELIAVCSSTAIASSEGARVEAANTLYAKQAEGFGKDYLKELHDHAVIEYR